MQNYYQILGLGINASQHEIKAAFRRLAKLYHPDKNPQGQDQFKMILKAYETLSDEYLKSQYDYKLRHSQNTSVKQTAKSSAVNKTGKSYDFSEEELKRRQYYREHYQKNQAEFKQVVDEAEKKSSNEFRNILIATPIAIFLIMSLLNVWSTKPNIEVVSYKEEPKIEKITEEPVRKTVVTGAMPFSDYYGGPFKDTVSKAVLKIRNLTGYDIVVFFFAKNKFIRTGYIENSYELELNQLPGIIEDFKIMSGLNFKYINELKKVGLYGTFSDSLKFYKHRRKTKLNGYEQLTLSDLKGQGFKEIDETDFFKKQ